MYSFHWFASMCSGSECVETLDEAKERFAFVKAVFGAYHYEVYLRATYELVLKG